MPLNLSILDPTKKAKGVKQGPETVTKATVEDEYPIGDGKIKNPADYFDIHSIPIKEAKTYDPRANPTSIALSSRCHPQEVYEQAIVLIWDEETQSLGHGFKTMLNCRKFGSDALDYGDYERACVLHSRAIGIAIALAAHPEFEGRFKPKGVQTVKKLKDDSIKQAASLAAVINARFFFRKNGREAQTKPTTAERPPRDVWFEIARSWRAVKDSVARPEATTPDLVVQNLQLEEDYVTPPAVAQTPASVQRQPSSSSTTAGHSQPTIQITSSVQRHPSSSSTAGHSQRTGSTEKRRSSISKFDKDLPTTPIEPPSESGFSFNVEYSESPQSATVPLAWDREGGDDDDNLPSYGDVLLEAYADDPNPPALVRALRRGEVEYGDIGLLSGANSSMVSLNLDVLEQPGTTYHSAASSAPPSDSEDGPFYSALPSPNRVYEGKTSAEKPKKVSEKADDDNRQSANKWMDGEKKRPCPTEKTTADLARDQEQLEQDLEAVAGLLKKIVVSRKSLPKDADHDGFKEKTKSALEQINKLVDE
ncbi:hypothetical protein BKA70DRAFT_605378 [Coprinopsis sp. MPI-PUGE-AT-0042]|nr:hypothetical protein BKA70DRAFT_605378 [Coprinopsis sp. MPI-PUGE-AT-0042]